MKGFYFITKLSKLKEILNAMKEKFGNIEIAKLPMVEKLRYDEIRRQAEWMNEDPTTYHFQRRTQPLNDEQLKNSRDSMDADTKEKGSLGKK